MATGIGMKKLAVIVGTRPEAIKLAPVIHALQECADTRALVCNTGQHEQLCGETLAYFDIHADARLDVMRPGQSLSILQARLMAGLDDFLAQAKPDGVIVQGDTMSAFCGALSSFYRHIPVFHVEAGLRSNNLDEPFPEEGLRQMLARIASLHFAPTAVAASALENEGLPRKNIFVTGNTVIDALFQVSPLALANAKAALESSLDFSRSVALVTVHRRENHGARLVHILKAVLELAREHPDCQFVFPVHPNPDVRNVVREKLAGRPNILLTEPLAYPELVFILQNALLVLTDSGGIQEEAPSFGVPILVMRSATERQEGIRAGCARLVGTETAEIVRQAERVLSGAGSFPKINPYGDGHAAERIMGHIQKFFAASW